jgi:hypothetical protein
MEHTVMGLIKQKERKKYGFAWCMACWPIAGNLINQSTKEGPQK